MPIIHVRPDLGSLAPVIDKRSSDLYGERRWRKHKDTVSLFWDAIADYFYRLEVSNLKIYQDGLMANGQVGQRIIEEGAKRGSKNHEIVLMLMEKGGEIRKTEDVSLLKEEYDRLIKLAQTKSPLERALIYIGYKLRKDRLMKERDEFIAKRINETLQDGETGVLFMGAYHDVLPRLSKDILVEEVKEQKRVKAYFDELIRGRDELRFDQLAKYLAAPIDPGA